MNAVATLPRVPVRDADWRFLLPRAANGMFEHLLLIGGSAELGAYVADLGIARHVSRTPGGGVPADVVVVLSDAGVAIDSLMPHLAERAFVYIEVDRRQPGARLLTPRRMMRALERHGLHTAGAYWVKPGFPRRDMYLPFGRRGALRWYLDTVCRATSPARRVLKAALRGLAWQEGAFASVAPCYAVTAVRGMAPQLPAFVDHVCAGGNTAVEPVLLATGEADWNRLVFLLFEGDEEQPRAVIKLPRTDTFNTAVEREHAVLRDVGAMLPATLMSSIPSSTLTRVGTVIVTAETCVPGTSMATRSGPGAGGALDDYRGAAAWLTSFHRETTRGHVDAADWVSQELAGRLRADYAEQFGLTPAEQQLFEAAESSVDPMAGDLPIVWQHADFGPWNIFRQGDAVSVIDWEIARRGPALADLLYLSLHWGAAVNGINTARDRVRYFETLFCGRMPADVAGRAIYTELLDYMRGVGVPAALLPHVLLYMVAEQAVDRARRLRSAGHQVSRDVETNEYIGCAGALARHADTLFRGSHIEGLLYAAR